MKRYLIFPLLLCLTILALAPAPGQAARTPQPPACTTASPASGVATLCIGEVDITEQDASPQNSLVVSWLSPTAQAGQVRLSDGTTFDDVRGAAFKGTTHYVQVSNLQPNSNYQFDLLADGVVNNNGGNHWTTGNVGPAIPDPTTGVTTILGRIRNPDGSDATEALVYVTIRKSDGSISSLLSEVMTTDDAGYFHVPLIARTTDYSARFTFDKTRDKVTITATGAPGFVSTTVPISQVLLSQNLTLTLGAGNIAAATPTPSPLPPTSTPTPITPSATPTLVPASATAAAATETAVAFTETPTNTPRPPTAAPVRASATWTSEPTLTNITITVEPAQETQIAEATLQSTEQPGTDGSSVRVSPRLTATPEPGLAGTGLGDGLLLIVVAALAFGAAIVLAIGALWIWKR